MEQYQCNFIWRQEAPIIIIITYNFLFYYHMTYNVSVPFYSHCTNTGIIVVLQVDV